jgi:hypothetical protein
MIQTKFNKETIAKILKLLGEGNSMLDTSIAVGVSDAVINRWRRLGRSGIEPYKGFHEALSKVWKNKYTQTLPSDATIEEINQSREYLGLPLIQIIKKPKKAK